MPIRKSDDIENEGSDFANQKSTAKKLNIQARFDDTTHNDNPYDDAIQYLKKKVDQVIDETNTQTVASGSYNTDIKTLKTASGSFSTRVTANDAKITSQLPAVTTTQKGAVCSIISVAHTPGERNDTLTITVLISTTDADTKKTFVLNSQ
jgi:hypothetical protein